MTLNNLAALYSATQRLKTAEKCCYEVERCLEPFWKSNPQVHGDQMASILCLRALLCKSRPSGSEKDACAFARRASDAAYHPDLKQASQALIDQFSGDAH